MKRMKKLMSVMLALVMVLAMSTTAFAQAGKAEYEGAGSITINDAEPGQTYNAYQILYLENYDAENNHYAYKANSEWAEWLNTQTTYVSINAQGYVTWVENASVADFAEAAKDELTGKTSAGTASSSADAENPCTVAISGLDLGYYLVDTTLGTICSLDTTNPNVKMEEKNQSPTNEKKVEEDSNGSWGEKNDAEIGQVVNFRSTITVRDGAENYKFHDKMTSGLTWSTGSVVIKDKNGSKITADGNYTLVPESSKTLSDGCTFEIKFSKTFIDSLSAGDTIVIEYSATVNSDAVIADAGNKNESKVEYGDGNHTTTTPPDGTTTYVYDVKILKHETGNEEKALSGAKFVLLNSAKDKVATVRDGKLTGWVKVPEAGADETITWPENTTLTTGQDGRIEIGGLDAETYYLREIEAPVGYNKLANDEAVAIAGGTDSNHDGTLEYTTPVIKVANSTGKELPSTGGVGTRIFYVLGSILLVGAGVLLVTKKRMSTK